MNAPNQTALLGELAGEHSARETEYRVFNSGLLHTKDVIL